jgi:hypothetical protein
MENIMEKTELILLSEPSSDKLSNNLETQGADAVIISDECGDTLWDAVLTQGENPKKSNLGTKD